MDMLASFRAVMVVPLLSAESEPGWWESLLQGAESFFTVERVRDTVIVVLSVGAYIALVHWMLRRMLLAPMRMVLLEELRSLHRCGLSFAGLDDTSIESLVAAGGNSQEKEHSAYRALLLLRDGQVAARRGEVEGLSDYALVSAAFAVKDKLHPPIDGLLNKPSLTESEAVALRQVLVDLAREQAAATAINTRLMLRRIRKSQTLAIAGALLLVLLVALFGNPALVAFGVLGAVVSRMISFFRSSTDDDQKYNWVALMLTPIVGGLSGYAGVLLVEGMRAWGVLGEVFVGVRFGGESANSATLAGAFLFGFAERLLDSVVGKAVDGLAPIMAENDGAGVSSGGNVVASSGGDLDGSGAPSTGPLESPTPVEEAAAEAAAAEGAAAQLAAAEAAAAQLAAAEAAAAQLVTTRAAAAQVAATKAAAAQVAATKAAAAQVPPTEASEGQAAAAQTDATENWHGDHQADEAQSNIDPTDN